jgi:hypothetical protein
MKSKNPLEAAEVLMLSRQAAYAHKTTTESYIEMLRAQLRYYQLLAEVRGQRAGGAGSAP